MSAAFAISYNDTLKRDIRHIHSGPSPMYRKPVYHAGITIQDRIREQQTQYRYKVGHYPTRNLVYLSKYEICIPKAPAFNVLDRQEIADLVSRLNNPTTHEYRFKLTDKDIASNTGSNVSSASSQRSRTRQKGGNNVHKNGGKTGVNVAALVDRLYREGQTHSSKSRMKESVVTSVKQPVQLVH